MRFGFTIVSVLLSVLMIGCVGSKQLEHPSVTIFALGPTGETFFIPHPQQIWTFAITNRGNCDLEWRASIVVNGLADKDYSRAGGFVDWPEGVLAPGQGLHTEMIVPAKSGSVWRAEIQYWTTLWPTNEVTRRKVWTYKGTWH